ncbi:MAG: ParA family protein [Blastocatellia bacterium]
MKVITISNHKGGCGKSVTALNIAVTLAQTGSRVLAVDLDFQGNLSAALGVDLGELESTKKTTHRLLIDDKADYSTYLTNCRPRLDILPACLDAEAETLLDGQVISKELLLKQKLSVAHKQYDYCVIDTPPALRVPTLNALTVSDLTIVPIESSVFALLGLNQLLRIIAKIRKIHAPNMIIMALSTMFASRQHLDKDVRAQVLNKFTEDFVFQTTIPRAVAVGEATITRQAVVETEPESAVSFAFHKLVSEIKGVLGDGEERSQANARITI